MVVEFSGLLAANRHLQEDWNEANNGILAYSDEEEDEERLEALLINLTDKKWSLNNILGQPHRIISASDMIETLIVKSLGDGVGEVDRSYVLAEMKDFLLQTTANPLVGAFDDVDGVSIALMPGRFFKTPKDTGRVLMIGSDGADAVQLDLSDSPAIVIGGSGENTVIGGSQSGVSLGDVIIGGKDRDVLTGGAGNDWFYGGSGTNTIDGGAGHDTAIYARGGTMNVRYDSNNTAGPLSVFGTGIDDTLTSIEHLKIKAESVLFDLRGRISGSQLGSEANLLIEVEGRLPSANYPSQLPRPVRWNS